MALNIKLNLDDCYEIEALTKDWTLSTFTAPLQNGEKVSVGVEISDEEHRLLPGVHNLAFGPLNKFQQIDDSIKIYHKNYSKLFSTILLCGVEYLTKHKNKFLGIDGSNNARAYLYYRCLLQNMEYLNKYLNLSGVNYYVRVLRELSDSDDQLITDQDDWIAMPEPITKRSSLRHEKLYNYLTFKLRAKCTNTLSVIFINFIQSIFYGKRCKQNVG